MVMQRQNEPETRRKREVKPAKTRADLLAEYDQLPDNARINEVTVAAVLLCSLAKLQRDRWAGGGIRFVREGGTRKTDKNGRTQIYGGKIFYLKADIEAHLASKRPVFSTSEIGGACNDERT